MFTKDNIDMNDKVKEVNAEEGDEKEKCDEEKEKMDEEKEKLDHL